MLRKAKLFYYPQYKTATLNSRERFCKISVKSIFLIMTSHFFHDYLQKIICKKKAGMI